MESEMINTAAMLKVFIDELDPKSVLYVDIEGKELSRHGTLSLITILVEARHTVHLVDVTTLQEEASKVIGNNGQTLKHILESGEIIKVFFNVRNDSDALFSHFQVSVGGIEDLQLMELATRTKNRQRVQGLERSIEKDAQLSAAEIKSWKEVKTAGKKLFAPERGGSYALFDERPLNADLLKYSVQDALYMPALRKTYNNKLAEDWKAKVAEETVARIAESQSAAYNPKSNDKTEGPKAWQEAKKPRKASTFPDHPKESGPMAPMDY